MIRSPKVFVSHASEDRERFVEGFAKRLRENGVDAWTSFWEMNPGDSLVDKIFGEGLGNCDAMIVVLSEKSVNKKWVREELNAGMVKRIEENTKLIPLRLDGCEVPECLKSTVWQEIPDLQRCDEQFDHILSAIFGMYERPPLGSAPEYVEPEVLAIGDLSRVDSIIFEAACRKLLEQPDNSFIEPDWLIAAMGEKGISETQIMETQEVLEGRGYVKVSRTIGPHRLYEFTITTFGFDQFVRTGIPDYGEISAAVAARLVRNEDMNSRFMAQTLGQPLPLIEHIFRSLESNSLIKYSESIGGGLHMDVYSVSPELRRKLEGST